MNLKKLDFFKTKKGKFVLIALSIVGMFLFWDKYLYRTPAIQSFVFDNCDGDHCVGCRWDDIINGNCDPEYNPYKKNGILLTEKRLREIMNQEGLSDEEVLEHVNHEIDRMYKHTEMRSNAGRQGAYNEKIERLEGIRDILSKK